jgi:hypothetical protein
MTTDTDHCPTCGTHVDEHTLDVMMRNRAARDAHFRELSAQLTTSEAEEARWWNRLKYGSAALMFVVIMSWIIWASANITQLKLGAK